MPIVFDPIKCSTGIVDIIYYKNILFEEFENWADEKDDESFLFLINHYWESQDKPVLDADERDLTGQEDEIKKIKESSK